MKYVVAVAAIVALAVLSPLEGRASSVTWIANPTSPAIGQVTGSATVVVDAGWTIDSIAIEAVPLPGGGFFNKMCVYTPPKAAGSLTGLTSNVVYQVTIKMVTVNGPNHQNSSTAVVNVKVK